MLYQALDEADIVISNGGGTLHADLSGTVPVNHTSCDARVEQASFRRALEAGR